MVIVIGLVLFAIGSFIHGGHGHFTDELRDPLA
jgi:hypothetical protein